MKISLTIVAAAAVLSLPAAKLVPAVTQQDLKTTWGAAVLSTNADNSVRVTSKNSSGPASLAAVNTPVAAGATCTFSFEARGDVRLQVMLNYVGDGKKNQRVDLVMPTALTGEWRKFESSFTVPAGYSRVTLDLLIWQQTGYADIRNFQFLKPPQRNETAVFDEYFRQGELIRNKFSTRIPAGWTEWNNGSAPQGDKGGLSKDYSFASKAFHSLRVPVPANGSTGWISRPTPLYRPLRPMRFTLFYRVTDDFSGGRPFAELRLLGKDGRPLNGKSLRYDLEAVKGNKWTPRVFPIAPADLPAEAQSFQMLLGVQRTGGSTAGAVYFGLARIMLPENDGSFARIRGLNRFNWYRFGEPVRFQAFGTLPEGTTAVVGKIRTAGGKPVTSVTVSAEDMEKGFWSWQPAEPGMYFVDFSAVTPRGEVSLEEEYQERAMNNQIGLFTPGGHSFAVVRDRDSGPAPALFGYQLGCSPSRIKSLGDTEVQMAKRAGGSFARFHVTWMEIEPEKGKFNWDALDYYVDKCVEAGIRPVVCFYGTPRWASNTPDDERYVVHVWAYNAYAAKDINDWTNFIEKMVNRYKGRVSTWEVWNEPHLRGYSCYWHDTPENFVKLLKAAYQTIKRIQPESTIWLGGIALRYLPFYDRIIELGAGKYFDRIAIHGHGQHIAPFYALDRKHNSPVHRWVNSEWHASLIRYTDPAYKLNETQRTLRMMIDLFSMMRQGVEEVAFFEPFNLVEKETLKLHTEGGAPLNHTSGIFRRKPYFQPMLGSVVMANFSRQFSGRIEVKGFYRFDKQTAVLFKSDAGTLLAFWLDGKAPETISPQLAKAIAKSPVETWEGRPVSQKKDLALEPFVIYYARNPEIPADWKAEANIRRVEAAARPLEHKISGVYSAKPLFTADGKLIPENIHWNSEGFALQRFAAAPADFRKPTRFALALFDGKLQLVVETRDEINHQPGEGGNMWQGDAIEFAFDIEGRGVAGNRIEFMAGKTKKGDELFKSANPSLVGDLPTEWTLPGMTVKNGRVEVRLLPKEKNALYLVELPLTELYPYIPQTGQTIRFSLIANESDGKNRTGIANWARGIFNAKDPVEYGDLKPVK